MYEQIRFKRLILEFDTGEAVEINGAYIREVTIDREFRSDRFEMYTPDKVTIVFDVYGNQVWAKRTATQQPKSLSEHSKQLPFVPKVLPEHKT